MPWKTMADIIEVRRAFLDDHANGAAVADLIEHYAIHKSTAYKLLARCKAEGIDAAVLERSRAPHNVPGRLRDDVLELVLCLRAAFPTWGPKKLRQMFANSFTITPPSRASFANVLRDYELTREYRVRRGLPTTTLVEARAPNDVWAADHKGLMKRLNVEPLNILDSASRFWLLCSPLAAKTYRDTREAFEHALDEYGAPLAVRVDGGAPWSSASPSRLTAFSAWLISLGIKVEVVARCQQNGRVERLHGTMEREMNRSDVGDVRAFFERERRLYNELRPHEAIDMKVPADVYRRSKRIAKEREPDYGDCDEVRYVDHHGNIRWKGKDIFVSQGLVRRYIGLRQLDQFRFRARYYDRFVGVIDTRRPRLSPA